MKFSSQQRQWMWVTVVTAALFLSPAATPAADGGPAPALKSLSADGQMTLSKSDRCPVCAMFPAQRPQTAAAMTLKSGETFYFCGNGCLLRTWLRSAVYLGRSRAEIDRLVVRDYFSGQPIDGRTATWVAGSDVVGPMGPAIIALGDPGQLAVFKGRHGGKTVFTLDQVDDDLWKQISRRELPEAKTD
ncbi:nitrous oxide reductase accessory protein NosL [uncultured Desulfosarcina sp.]|uniref:nitrous oxide reductase accessory protein NosL n=1 Tax=uncultured Desulfosarcina sp. TaxID=218289 RepID=UPI0029C8C948|nr:nitrous oxide reductase accessory protein NosL [uncultured Desulfosarcina sp.]